MLFVLNGLVDRDFVGSAHFLVDFPSAKHEASVAIGVDDVAVDVHTKVIV